MDSELAGNSLEKLIGYYEHSSAESQISILKESYGLSDFNNVETADRKLIINNKLEFWVHDFVLNSYCDYFRENLETERPKKYPIMNPTKNIQVKEFNLLDINDEPKKIKIDEKNNNNINNVYTKFILKNTNFNIKSSKNNIKEQNDKIKENKINKIEINKINDEKKEIKEIFDTSETTIKEDIKDINITRINFPSKNESDLFFEVLLWMYTKDKTKLKKFTKNFEMLLYLLSLGIFLKMKKEYFKVLLSNLKIVWSKELFDIPLWTRDKFSFHVLDKIIPLINTNYLRIYALISWLKSIDLDKNQIIKDKDTINKCMKSKDFFLVRNYIKKYKLMTNLSKDELLDIKNKFEDYIDCLDMEGILNSYLFIPLSCIICKTDFDSVYEVLNHKSCKNEKYHPPCGQMDSCQHKGCQKRLKKGEYNCCHKKLNEKDSGCLIGEGKHIFIINNKK